MANNCFNYIQINGSVEEIKEFRNVLKYNDNQKNGTDVHFNLRAHFDAPVGNDGRWFNIDTHEAENETEILISGDSAWTPCLELFTAISKKYQSFVIRYEYDESGCDFSGWAEIEKGFCNDHQFTYWKGLFERNGEDDTLYFIITNELECYDTEEELKEADFFELFSEENQNEILENWRENNQN